MQLPKSAAIAIALLSPAALHAQAPTAPEPTMGALLKVLRFDWEPVPGATHYQLHYKSAAGAPFTQQGGNILAPRTVASLTIPVHLLEWDELRFKVLACNSSGCSESAEIPGSREHMISSIGYFKSSNSDPDDRFGSSIALSQDGNTMVAAAYDDSRATGVNGDQSDNTFTDTGAAYVFRRTGNGWRQEAYLKGDLFSHRFGAGFGGGQRTLALSSDGSVLAVGVPENQDWRTPLSGVVFLFRRDAGGQWSLAQTLTSPTPRIEAYFGASVDLSDDGNVVKVLQLNEHPRDGDPGPTLYLFRWSGTAWVRDVELPRDDADSCSSQMSGTAASVLLLCRSETAGPRLRTLRLINGSWLRAPDVALTQPLSSSPAMSGNAGRAAVTVLSASGVSEVRLFTWSGSRWVADATVSPPEGAAVGAGTWGRTLALNRNGTLLAVGHPQSSNGGLGVSNTPWPPALPPPDNEDGAVYVYQRGAGGWSLAKVVKAGNAEHADAFGESVWLSGNGTTMAVSAPFEDSAARGISGDWWSNTRPDSGAVYLY